MDFKTRGKLLVTIEKERRQLYETAKRSSKNSKDLIRASKRLDNLIILYQKSQLLE